MKTPATIEFEKQILKILRNNMQGYPALGAIGAGLMGSGTGGTIGLVKAVKRHNEGEMDQLDTKGKIKEYAKEILPRAGAGAAAGAGLGLAGGAGYKEFLARKVRRGLLDHDIKNKVFSDPEAREFYMDMVNQPEYKVNVMNALKKKMLGGQ